MRGLPEVQRQILRRVPQFEEGVRLISTGERDPRIMAEELAQTPRSTSDIEQAMLIYDRMRITNDHTATMNALEKAVAIDDKSAILENRLRLAKLEDDLNNNDEAGRHTGTQLSAAFRMRQQMIAEDYSLPRSLQRVRVAIGGKEIPPAVREKLENLTKQLQESIEKSRTYEDKISQLESEKKIRQTRSEVDRITRQRAGTRAPKAVLSVERQELFAKFRSTIGRVQMLLDPEQVLVMGQLARNYVQEGILDAKKIVDEIKNELKDIPDLTKRDIRDAISGYGVTAKLSQDEINTALREARRQMRLISAIEDAQAKTVPLRSGLQRDPVSDQVRAMQREVRQAMRESGIDSTATRTPEEQWRTSLEGVKTRLRNQISDLNEQLTTGKKTPKKLGIKYDKEAQDLRAERDQLKGALVQIEGKPGLSNEQRVRIALNAVQKSIDEYERRIQESELTPQRKISATPETPELKALRARRQVLVDRYRQMQQDARPIPDPQAAALKAYKTRTLNRISELQEMLKTGDFEKSARRVLKMDPEAMKLRVQVQKIKEQVDMEVRKQKLAARTKVEKGMDYLVKWRRFALLSGTRILGKLSAMVMAREISTPITEMVGSGTKYLPYLRGIAAQAPRYGAGFNVRAEAAALRQYLEKQTWLDIPEILKTGRGELDRLYGKKHDLPPEAMQFFGHLHQAVKTLERRPEFSRSIQHILEWHLKQGHDVSEPLTMATIYDMALLEADRAIFMQPNKISSAFRTVVRMAESRDDLIGRTGAHLLQLLFPFTRVGPNIAMEHTDWIVGIPKAAAKLYSVGGVKGLTPEAADYVMRNVNRNVVGIFLIALGYYGIVKAGGYYRRGEKRKKGELKPGEIKIGGMNFPYWLFEAPFLGAIQAGATLRNVQNYYSRWNLEHPGKEKKTGAVGEAARETTAGVMERVPFFEEPGRIYEAMKSPTGTTKWTGELAESMAIPPDLRRLALSKDMAGDIQIPREQKTYKQIFQGALPGQRKKLPVDMNRIKQMTPSQLNTILNKAPKGALTGNDRLAIYKTMMNKVKREVEQMEKGKAVGNY